MMIKKSLFILPLFLLIFISSSCDKNEFEGMHEGVIKDLTGLDSCSYVIELNNGTNLMVTNLYDFDVAIEDNKEVWVRYESVEMPNMCICGQVVTIDDLQER